MSVVVKRCLYLYFISLFFCCFSCKTPAIYVANTGNDHNPGSSSKPVASIQKALELSRDQLKEKIIIREGKYYDVSVNLLAKDSGLTISGEAKKNVNLYGGILLKNWRKEGNWFVTDVAGVKNKSWDFRLLMVNDTLRNRARLREAGALTHLSNWDYEWMSAQGGWSKKPSTEDLSTLIYNPKDLGSRLDINNAELTVFHMWDDSYVNLKSIDTVKHQLKFGFPATHPPGSFKNFGVEKAQQYIVWNTKEGMKQPGQWYLDRTSEKLYYWPFLHEKLENMEALVPTKNQIINLEKGANHINIQNIQLSCAGAPISNAGYGANEIQGAIQANGVNDINFRNVSVKNTSGWAIKVKGADISITASEFSSTYAGGISFEGKNIRVERCGIHDIGKLYNGSVGINGDGENNIVSHCELFNLPYAGINGLGKRSIAEYNLIYNFKTMLEDGGAFYCYGGDSTVYRNNAALSATSNTREGWTYYFDEQSKNCIMENNLAFNTINPVHNHMADGIIIRNNFFIDQTKQRLTNQLCSNIHFSENTFVADNISFINPIGEIPLQKKETYNSVFQKYYTANGIVEFRGNMVYSNSVSQEILHMYATNRSERMKMDQNSLVTDPANRLLLRTKIPEIFNKVGYRGNFKEVFQTLNEE